MKPLVELEDVGVMRAGKALFNHFNYCIHAGEITVVLGPNGAGKSSLLLAIAGLIPSSGTICIHDKPLKHYDKQALAQEIAWHGSLPPAEFGLTVRQRLQLVQSANRTIDAITTVFDIAPLLDRDLGELSSGERQRVELSALMLRDAPVYLLDEPTTHLDFKHQVAAIRMLQQQATDGRGIVVVLHDLQQAAAVADHLILIDRQRGCISGNCKTLLQEQQLTALFDSPFTQRHGLMPDYTASQ